MRKAPEAFRTISEAAEILDIPAHVLRFWESRFPQIRPVKRAGGRRYYRPVDIDLLAGIKLLLHDQGMTIRGVQKLLQDHGPRHVAELAPISDTLDADVIDATSDPLDDPEMADPELDHTSAPWPDDATALDPTEAGAELALDRPLAPAPAQIAADVAPDPAPSLAPGPAPELPAEGPANAFAGLGDAPLPSGPVQRALAPDAPPALEPSRFARQFRQGAQVQDPARAAALALRLQALLDRIAQAEARDRARL